VATGDVLGLDGERDGLVLRHVVHGPHTIEDVQSEITAENVLDQLAVAPAGSSRLDLERPQDTFIERDRSSYLRHGRIIASKRLRIGPSRLHVTAPYDDLTQAESRTAADCHAEHGPLHPLLLPRLAADTVRRVHRARSVAARSIDGFLRHGPAFWPGAHHFVMVEVREDGDLTGDGWEVCHDCLREAARMAAARLEVGDATFYDLAGETEGSGERCRLCGGGL